MKNILLLCSLVAVSSASYMGCYHHEYNGLIYSQLTYFGDQWSGLNTPELCMGHCSSLGFSYCGLVWGNQCGCGNDPPSEGDKQDDEYCDTECVGDSTQVCGGPGNSQVVYQIDNGGGPSPTTTDSPPSPPTFEPTPPSPTTTEPPPSTEAPCLDTKPESWCSQKCSNDKKCQKKRCSKKCALSCNLCGETSTQSPTSPPTTRSSTTSPPTIPPTTSPSVTSPPTTSPPTSSPPITTGSPTTSPPTTNSPTTSPPGTGYCDAAKYDYAEVLEKSMLFYEAQRSGPLPADNRVPWRGDSALSDAVVGGYYDAGDFVKFGFPMAAMTTQLAWGAISFQEGYENAGQMEYIKDTIQWATDYFITAHVGPDELVGQIGNGHVDHSYWGRPEDMTMDRPAYSISPSKPGSDLAGETAAALASASIFYNNIGETALADEALSHAIDLFDFANTYKGKYSDSISDASSFYNSWSGYEDELAWGAAWMYKATGDGQYLDLAKQIFNSNSMCNSNLWFGWDNKVAGVQVLMYDLTGQDPEYKTCVDNYMNALDSATYTPKGLIFVDNWGSNRHAGNNAHLCAQLANMGYQTSECDDFVEDQIHYILGDTGRSFVVGFGENPPLRPHHRSSSCPDTPAGCGDAQQWDAAPNPQTLYGALVGGPDANDNYNDARDDYVSNEVATDYNAGFQSAVAYLAKINC